MKQLWYFTAGWCQPCQQFGPVMSQVSQKGISINKIENATTCDFYLLAAGEAFLHKTIQINTIKIFS